MTDEDDGQNYSASSSGTGDSEESDDEDDDEEQPLKPGKILARKTMKPAEWREMCKDMKTDQVCMACVFCRKQIQAWR